ncbi:MAG: hypothetical protein GPOALKHO_000177 [Sodalis sp.]|nr:MAG: hypothetical protein GPOALKHO_000177 [Sodalis sp.]
MCFNPEHRLFWSSVWYAMQVFRSGARFRGARLSHTARSVAATAQSDRYVRHNAPAVSC